MYVFLSRIYKKNLLEVYKKSTKNLQKNKKNLLEFYKNLQKKKGNPNLLNIVKMVWGRLHPPVTRSGAGDEGAPIPFSPASPSGKS